MRTGEQQGISDKTRRRLAWAVPAVVAGGIAAAVGLTAASASGTTPDLPPRTAAQLLVDVQHASAPELSGVFTETANFGLPSLPGDRSPASLSWQNFVTGTHSAKVWLDGAARQRIALQGELSEAEVVHNGRNLWTYTSATNTATHTVVPMRGSGPMAGHAPRRAGTPDARALTPTALAAKVLKAVRPSTSVSVKAPQNVADRPAYILVIRPRDHRSTIRKVTIAIDAAKFIPLRVQVFGDASSPALESGFTSISFHRPSASAFHFTVPTGATVTKNPLSPGRPYAHHVPRPHMRPGHVTGPKSLPSSPLSAQRPRFIGSGWTTVVELHNAGNLLDTLPSGLASAGPHGTRVLHTALVNAVILPDGRTFVGAVKEAALQHIAAATAN